MPSTVNSAGQARTSGRTAPWHSPTDACTGLRTTVAAAALGGFVIDSLLSWLGTTHPAMSTHAPLLVPAALLGCGWGWVTAWTTRSRRPPRCWPVAAFAALVVTGTVLPPAAPTALVVVAYVVATTAVVAGLARWMAPCWHPGLRSIRATFIPPIAGVLAGLGCSCIVKLTAGPPITWVMIACLGYAVLGGHIGRVGGMRLATPPLLLLCAAVAVVGIDSMGETTTWSAYTQLTTAPQLDGTTALNVNGTPQRELRDPGSYQQRYPLAQAPYERAGEHSRDRALVLGSGTGNDVALALGRGYRRVDAVELDPNLIQVARQRHPAQPYHDSRVNVHLDDARAFLRRTGYRYDLIVIAAPTSRGGHASASVADGRASLLTTQTLHRAAKLLRPDGVLGIRYPRAAGADPLPAAMDAALGGAVCVDDAGRGQSIDAETAVTGVRASNQLECPRSYRADTPSPASAPRDTWASLPTSPADRWLGAGVLLGVGAIGAVTLGWFRRRSPTNRQRLPEASPPDVESPTDRRWRRHAGAVLLGCAFALSLSGAQATAGLLYGTSWQMMAAVHAAALTMLLVVGLLPVRRGAVLAVPSAAWYAVAAFGTAAPAIGTVDKLTSLPAGLRPLVVAALFWCPVTAISAAFLCQWRLSSSCLRRGSLAAFIFGTTGAAAFLAVGYGLGALPGQLAGTELGWPALALVATVAVLAAAWISGPIFRLRPRQRVVADPTPRS